MTDRLGRLEAHITKSVAGVLQDFRITGTNRQKDKDMNEKTIPAEVAAELRDLRVVADSMHAVRSCAVIAALDRLESALTAQASAVAPKIIGYLPEGSNTVTPIYAAPKDRQPGEVCIVCDWTDANPLPRFVEVEIDGHSVCFGWRDRGNGIKEIVIPVQLPAVPVEPPASVPDGFYLSSFKRKDPSGAMLWWGPDNAGYTPDIEQAGIYTEITPGYHDSDYTVPVPVGFVAACRIRRTLDPSDSKNRAFWSAADLRAAIAANQEGSAP